MTRKLTYVAGGLLIAAVAVALLFVVMARTLAADGCMWVLGFGGCF